MPQSPGAANRWPQDSLHAFQHLFGWVITVCPPPLPALCRAPPASSCPLRLASRHQARCTPAVSRPPVGGKAVQPLGSPCPLPMVAAGRREGELPFPLLLPPQQHEP